MISYEEYLNINRGIVGVYHTEDVAKKQKKRLKEYYSGLNVQQSKSGDYILYGIPL